MLKRLNSGSDLEKEMHNIGAGRKFSREGYDSLFDYLERDDPNAEIDVEEILSDYQEFSFDQLKDEYRSKYIEALDNVIGTNEDKYRAIYNKVEDDDIATEMFEKKYNDKVINEFLNFVKEDTTIFKTAKGDSFIVFIPNGNY